MGGQNPQDMMKRGMPMLGQVPGAVKKGPLGQLHKDTSEFISPTPEPKASFDKVDEFGNPPGTIEGNVISPDEQEFIDAQKVDEQVAKQKEYQDAGFAYPLDETITDKEFLMEKIQESKLSFTTYKKGGLTINDPLHDLQAMYRDVLITQ